ncbi:MAG: ABC transporter ATP-binding protein [Anaerolineae bacterium]|nr:ABC transporter ATP-binding protein [Anaerolineae bacterium]
MIQVEGLTKYYGPFKAIDSLSFHADAGEIVGFLGPNGAGKTTTMRILTGYMPPSEGRATIAGFDVFEQSLQARERIGYLPETVPLYKELTVWQYVDYMAALRGMRNPNRAERVDEVLDRVEMLDRADSMISSLSKGMRQRVGLAQAIVHRPDVLILDEPTIGLDPRQVREVRELVREVGQERTVLLSTHILSEVSQLCSRILIINKGQIVAEDSPATLASRLQGTTRLSVRVGKATPKEVAKAIRGIEGIDEVIPTDEGVEVISSSQADPRSAISATIVQKSWELLEIHSVDMSLEDIFLQLTTDETMDEEEDQDA